MRVIQVPDSGSHQVGMHTTTILMAILFITAVHKNTVIYQNYKKEDESRKKIFRM